MSSQFKNQKACNNSKLFLSQTVQVGFCCTIIDGLHVENEKDLPHRFGPAHTYLYFSCKLSIIIAKTTAMFDFFENLKYGFCCTIKGKFHAKNENDPPIDSEQST